MSYHISVTRQRHGSKADISLDEWLNYVRASSDLEFETLENTGTPSQGHESNHAARWRGTDAVALLEWSCGEIRSRNPSDEVIRYMIGLAPRFNARVRGDEGEFYRSLEDYYYEEGGRELSWEEHEQREREHAAKPLNRVKNFLGKFGLTLFILLVFYLLHRLVT